MKFFPSTIEQGAIREKSPAYQSMISSYARYFQPKAILFALLVLILLVPSTEAASVGPVGYTNDFSGTVPSPADWSTATIAGGPGDATTAAGLDAAVQVLAATGITTAVTTDSGNPPAAGALAAWSSSAQYLQTRPTGVKMAVLLGRFVNNSGTNANVLQIGYDFQIAAPVTEEILGHRAYYSFTGAAGDWANIPALDSPPAGRLSATVLLPSTWNTGTALYLLWADDNGSGSPDDANQIDNFFLAAYYTNLPLTIALSSPSPGQHFGAGSVIGASVALSGSPTNVSYYLDDTLAASRNSAPFTPVNLPGPSVGSHHIYATAQDANNTLVTTATNTFVVDLSLGGTLSGDTTLYSSNGVYTISSSLIVPSGVTLTIEPGVELQFAAGQSLTVANGGRLLADGTSNAPIHLTRSGTSGYWGNVTINGALGSVESRIAWASFDFNANNTGTPCIEVNAGSAFLNHLTFGQTGAPYIHVDGASFTISDCYFPAATAQFEPCHGTMGVRRDGHGLFLRNYFGKPIGYNDVVDFTGGNRTNPIVQFIGNVVAGGDDDGFDLDGTDAWVEGNIFLHLHRNNGTPDSSGAVSGGNSGNETSEITIIRNIFYDCDQAADAKQGNFFTFFNNTIVHQTHIGGIDPIGAVVILADTGTTQGAGTYLEGNIVEDAEALTRNVTNALVTFTNNILHQVQGPAWTGPGGNNSIADPLLKYAPQLSETYFTNWASTQVMWDWFSLLPGSPAIGTGPSARDKGAVVPAGASISGAPTGTTSQTDATLQVGINRRGSGISSVGWPSGSGYVAYRWRLDTNAWSAETPITQPIALTGLADGPHYVEVIGENDAGFFQNDPLYATNDIAVVTVSPTWHVQGPFALTPGALSVSGTTTTFNFQFTTVAGQSYSVFYRDAFDPAHPWTKLLDISPAASTSPISITDSNATVNTRFYRVVAPAQP